jgi:hypothetical protein
VPRLLGDLEIAFIGLPLALLFFVFIRTVPHNATTAFSLGIMLIGRYFNSRFLSAPNENAGHHEIHYQHYNNGPSMMYVIVIPSPAEK